MSQCSLCEDTGVLILYRAKGDKRSSELITFRLPEETVPIRIQAWEEAERTQRSRDGVHFWYCPLCWRGKKEHERILGRLV